MSQFLNVLGGGLQSGGSSGGSPFPAPVVTAALYVDKGGNDSTGDGTPNKPFLTIGRATDAVLALGDQSASKIYGIFVGPGTYVEDVELPAFCCLMGTCQVVEFSETIISGNIQLDGTWGVTAPIGAVWAIKADALTGGIGGATVPVNCAQAQLYVSRYQGTVTINWRDAASILYAMNWNCEFFNSGNATIRNGKLRMWDSFVGNQLTVQTNGAAVDIKIYGGTVNALDIQGNDAAMTFQALLCNIPGAFTASGTTSCASIFDNASYPIGTITLTNGATIALTASKTITTGGVTGAVTSTTLNGTVNFAAAATSLVVTHALVTTGSIITIAMRTNDTTAVLGSVVAGAGSFTIRMKTAPTAETSVGYVITAS